MYAEILNTAITVSAVSYILATAAVLATKYTIKMLQIDFHII